MYRTIIARLSLSAALIVAVACGDTGPTAPTGSSVVVTADVPAGAIVVGDTARFEVWVARGADVTGSITLEVAGLPSGVTGTFSPAVLSRGESSSFLTLTASDSAVATTTSLTVRVQGAHSTGAIIALHVLSARAPNPFKKAPATGSKWYEKITKKKGT